MFSAVTSAFIVQVDSQLQPDPNNETTALLRVLIYKIDNTTFGNDVPTLPQWTGPPREIVQVQAILFASLAISLFSAFIAMLGKRWLICYQSTDLRGSAIERSHNRQQKLDGIVAWYFGHVMEFLPLMLQVALLLLGCALSRYLWEINVTIALVVLGVTSFGVIFYLFIVIAGTASENCPYQTPAAHILRHILRQLRYYLLPTLRSASAAIPVVSSSLTRLYQASQCRLFFSSWLIMRGLLMGSMGSILWALSAPLVLTMGLFLDVYHLGRAILRLPVSLGRKAFHQLVGRHMRVYPLPTGTSSLRAPSPHYQMIMLDLQCISWILHASLDKAVHLSTFKHLISMLELVYFDPALIMDCFNAFTGCINIRNGRVVIIKGLEELAMVSASAFFRTLHHLATTDPTSNALAGLQRRYNEVFPSELDFTNLPFHSTMTMIHTLAGRFGNPRDIQWHNYRMTIQEHIPFAQRVLRAAQEGYGQTQHRKVPRWTLHSALYLLSLGPVSPASVVTDCLTIVAIDLGCDVSDIVILDERCVQVWRVSAFLTKK